MMLKHPVKVPSSKSVINENISVFKEKVYQHFIKKYYHIMNNMTLRSFILNTYLIASSRVFTEETSNISLPPISY